jgi:hypothetical protein
VDQVREQRDAVGGDEDQSLDEGGDAEDRQRKRNRAQALTRALDAVVDQSVRMTAQASEATPRPRADTVD